MDKAVKKAGLDVIESKIYPIPKEMLAYQSDVFFQTINERSFGLDRVVGTEAGDALRKKVNDAYAEYRLHGTTMESDLVVCVARKATV